MGQPAPEAVIILDFAKSVGFDIGLAARRPNQDGALTPGQEQQIRAVLPDYAEFIIPVFWSPSDFVGAVADGKQTPHEQLTLGMEIISAASQFDPRSAPDTYFRYNVSGISLQPQNPVLRRQGFLAVCRESVAVVGAYSDFIPELTYGEMKVYHGMTEQLEAILKWKLPPADCTIGLEAHIPFNEIESVNSFELVRFDGLAAFLAAFDRKFSMEMGRDFAKALKKALKKAENPGSFVSQFSAYSELRANGPDYVDSFVSASFKNACEFQRFGVAIANGTGNDDNGLCAQTLFNSALGIVLEGSRSGLKFFAESPFSEIDAAFSLIQHGISSAKSKPVTNAAQETVVHHVNTSLADELERLQALHKSGVLTEEEFTAAKTAVLSRLQK